MTTLQLNKTLNRVILLMKHGTNIEIDGGIILSVAIGVDRDKYNSTKKEAARKKAER